MLDKARTLSTQARTAGRDAGHRVEAFFDSGPVRRGLFSLIRGIYDHHLAQAANAMAFDLFLATIPLVALVGWASANVLRESPQALGAVSTLVDQSPAEVRAIVGRSFGRLSGAVAPFAVLGSFWLSSSAFHTLMKVFEIALDAPHRPWWKKRLIALGCVAVAVLGVGATSYLAVFVAGGPAMVIRALTSGSAETVMDISNYLAVLFVLAVATALLAGFFRIAVHIPGVRRRVWPGAMLGVGIGGIASYAFGYYVRSLARYAAFYGSLAAVAIALVWLWIWCAALLVGAELNTQLENVERRRAPTRRPHF